MSSHHLLANVFIWIPQTTPDTLMWVYKPSEKPCGNSKTLQTNNRGNKEEGEQILFQNVSPTHH